ncbi:MAG: peptidyl-prolyl cis-trans isomerase [Muribaculaceae bacterium]|nr:peptidyl-prolyl cis-trans isomerase [Muribaculaceae bacterium]
MKRLFTRITLLGFLLIGVAGCSKPAPDIDALLVARVGQSRLTKTDIAKLVTPGMSAEDSAKLVRSYVKSWIESRVMSEMAVKSIPDMSVIDRMVEDYRNELIAWEYRRLMFNQHGNVSFSDDTIHSYYDNHKSLFVLERPLVKGVYIKVASDSPSLRIIKKLYKSTKPEDIDKLEKEDLQGVIHFDYFRDRWVDWEQIETRVPIDFGSSPEAFLATRKGAEVTSDGFTHLLEITDYLPTGSTMPFEWAEESIRRTLYDEQRLAYDSQLRLDLYNEGLKDGSIIVNIPLE